LKISRPPRCWVQQRDCHRGIKVIMNCFLFLLSDVFYSFHLSYKTYDITRAVHVSGPGPFKGRWFILIISSPNERIQFEWIDEND
jgi:hypothetical protein